MFGLSTTSNGEPKVSSGGNLFLKLFNIFEKERKQVSIAGNKQFLLTTQPRS